MDLKADTIINYREIKVMDILKGGPSILPLLDKLRNPYEDTPILVTKWVEALPYRVSVLSSLDFRNTGHLSVTTNCVTTFIRF